jgi:hypothetical protein
MLNLLHSMKFPSLTWLPRHCFVSSERRQREAAASVALLLLLLLLLPVSFRPRAIDGYFRYKPQTASKHTSLPLWASFRCAV